MEYLCVCNSKYNNFLNKVMAVLLELHYSKEDILEAYLNEVFLGQDGRRAVHGFGLASQYYFTQPLHELQLHQVALLVDNRADQALALDEAAAVTAYGTATEIAAAEHAEVLQSYLARHPQLQTFVSSPTTALFRIEVESYHLVQRFQNVTEFRMNR